MDDQEQKIHPYYLGQGESLYNELASMKLLSGRALDERVKPIVIEMLAEVIEVEAAYAKALHDRSKLRRERLEQARHQLPQEEEAHPHFVHIEGQIAEMNAVEYAEWKRACDEWKRRKEQP